MPVAIPDGGGVGVAIPVTLEAGCNCTVANVVIALGINHTRVSDLIMAPASPDFDDVLLVFKPPSSANLVSSNKITFDDTPDVNTKDPRNIGNGLGTSDPIPADTYYAQGSNPNVQTQPAAPPGAYPDNEGLGKFNGKTVAGDWRFFVSDFASGNNGTIESVDLIITCAEYLKV